jgi:methylphosphotriester-DNA--protein-cysteine methyltransferase
MRLQEQERCRWAPFVSRRGGDHVCRCSKVEIRASKSRIVRHFRDSFGRSANDLLTGIRMTLAANELKKSSMSTGAVVDTVGYQSEAAFQHAFKQRMGSRRRNGAALRQLPCATRSK